MLHLKIKTNLTGRSTITIQDHDSKFGTWLNGTDIKSKTTKVTSTDNSLKLAKMPDVMRYFDFKIVLTRDCVGNQLFSRTLVVEPLRSSNWSLNLGLLVTISLNYIDSRD
jgi:hypothetical protein